PQGVGRRGGEGSGTHLNDLFDTCLGSLRTARYHQGADLLGGVVQAPEADEVAVAEGDVDYILRADTEGPETVAPHLGDPVPILGAVEHTDRGAPTGAGG